MKAILKFSLPEDEDEFKRACKGGDYYISLCDIKEKIRSLLKYTEPKEPEILEQIRHLLPEDME